MSETSPEHRNSGRNRSRRPSVDELLAQAEREYNERLQRANNPHETPPPQKSPLLILSTEADVLASQTEKAIHELEPTLTTFQTATKATASKALLRVFEAYRSLNINTQRTIAVGAAALSITTVATLILPDSDPRLNEIDYSELADASVADVNVSFANLPIYYGIEIGDENGSIPYYISDDPKVTGKRTFDGTKMASLMYQQITSSKPGVEATDQTLVPRMPSLQYNNNQNISIHRTGDEIVNQVGKKLEVDRSQFSLVAVDYEPGDINAPDDAYMIYEAIAIDPEGVVGENVTSESLAELNLLFDADSETEGDQAHPDIINAFGYLARNVVSSRDWGCYADLRYKADAALTYNIDEIIEDQLGEEFNGEKRIVFTNDYQTPKQFYVENTLNGNSKNALEHKNFIIEEEKLNDDALVTCDIIDESTAKPVEEAES